MPNPVYINIYIKYVSFAKVGWLCFMAYQSLKVI